MKKLLVLLMVLALAGCSASVNFEGAKFKKSLQEESKTLDMMIGHWEYDFEDCAYSLSFYEEQWFSMNCACGDIVGDSDLVEYYIYDDKTKNFYLYGEDGKYVSKGKIYSVSEDKLDIEVFGERNVFEKKASVSRDPDENKFDASKQEPSENLDILIGEWEYLTKDCKYLASYTKDNKFLQTCDCGECLQEFECNYIYDDKSGQVRFYDMDKNECVSAIVVHIISEDEVEFAGNLYTRAK